MLLTLCPGCSSSVAFSERSRGVTTPCPNCGRTFAPMQSMPEEESIAVIERLHRWARDTEPGLRDTNPMLAMEPHPGASPVLQ